VSYGFTYILQAEDEDLFKVGYTLTSVEERMKALQTGSGHRLRLYKSIPSYFPDRLEKIIKTMLGDYRKHGEWYEVPDGMIDNVLSSPIPLSTNPWQLDGNPRQGVIITPTFFSTNEDGRAQVSSRCMTYSELEAEVYRLVQGLLQLLKEFEPRIPINKRYKE
jgi:Meiotically up-regulated gene 113